MATVFAAFGLLALLAVVVLCVQVGGAFVAKHRAQSAADLAALAAAGALATDGDACAAAGRYADGNGAAVDSCGVDGRTVRVRVRVSLPLTGSEGSAGPLPIPGPDAAEAAARAEWGVG